MGVITKRISEARIWVENSRWFYDQNLDFLKKNITNRDFHGLSNIALSLEMLSSYYGRIGQVRLADNHEGGWSNISLACAYRFISVQIRCEIYLRSIRAPDLCPLEIRNDIPDMGSLLAASIAFEIPNMQAYMTQALVSIIKADERLPTTYWRHRHFEPFILWLSDQSLADRDHNFGVYSQIIAHWNSDELSSEVIFNICDYHLLNMLDRGRKWQAEFTSPPFDLLPSEVVAIARVRENMGLRTADSNHELLHTGFQLMKWDRSLLDGDPVIRDVSTFFEGVMSFPLAI
ncbi:MAG TPA: hypothetical protein VFE47_05350 [Tepidisphaeraceae bacterium]|jgi:hypothetical protein|nr:hypothetical protein [Tepidisphaeraceae bacterium]